MKRTRLMITGVALAAASAMALTGCTPGSDAKGPDTSKHEVQTDVSKMGDITLTVWDQEVRGGQDEQMKKLNDAFHAKYPNVTIKRNSQSFDDLGKTLRLALTGKDAPDVVEAMTRQGNIIQPTTPDQAAKYFRSEAARYAALVKKANVVLE